jgi:hypothetical protein
MIASKSDIGDLMKALNGVHFEGFIGKLYQLSPFPLDPHAFKQKPDGDLDRATVDKQIAHFAEKADLACSPVEKNRIYIGPYLFDKTGFQELIRYVWVGGYPRWKDGEQPGYVKRMGKELKKSVHPLYSGLRL